MKRIRRALRILASSFLFAAFSACAAAHAALLYSIDNPTPQNVPYPSTSPIDRGGFGFVVRNIGDVNGDGIADLAVGAPLQEVAGEPDAGQLSIFSGSDGILLRTIDLPRTGGFSIGPRLNSWFGYSVAGLGDIDGDGVADLVVGAPGHAPRFGTSMEGAGGVFWFSGRDGSPIRALQPVSTYMFQANGSLGSAIAAVGDQNGDGVEDFVVGAPWIYLVGDDGRARERAGRAFVISGLDGSLLRELDSPNPEDFGGFGLNVMSAGDIDGDGIADVAVSAGLEAFNGRLYVFSGRDGRLVYSIQPAVFWSEFGRSMASVGDVNGDGIPDIVVGNPDVIETTAFLFSGSDGSHIRTFRNPVAAAADYFGSSIAGVGDVDGDGVPDVAVGISEVFKSSPGKVAVFSGASGSVIRVVALAGGPAGAQFGHSLSRLSDVDGDGMQDLAVGAPFYSSDGTSFVGRAFVVSLAALEALTVSGFKAPLASLLPEGGAVPMPSKGFQRGRTLPMKLELFAGGVEQTDRDVAAPRIVALERVGDSLPLATTYNLDAGQANDGGGAFRYGDGQWTFNLSTRALLSGTYHVTIEMADGRRYKSGFALR